MKSNDSQSAVAEVIQSLVDAWNRRDASSFANLFGADADYIDGDGRWLRGRSAIADLCLEGTGMPVSIVGVPMIRVLGEVAIATFGWEIVGQDSNRDRGTITFVTLESDAGFKIVALQNTDLKQHQ